MRGLKGSIVVASLALAYGCSTSSATDASSPIGEGGASDPASADPDAKPGAGRDGSSVADAGADPDAGTDPDAPAGVDAGPLSPSYVDYDVNHVLVTGQSNSVANGGYPILSTTQPFKNLMFDTGVMPMTQCGPDGCYEYQTPSSFVPLVEGDKFFDWEVETSAAGLANEASLLATQRYDFGVRAGYPLEHDVLVSVHGRSGNTYWCLRKGGCNYKAAGMLSAFAQGMMEVQSGKTLAAALGKSYAVRAVASIHGESDHYGYTAGTPEFPLPGTDGTPGAIADYSDALLEWQRDYEAGIKAITGQPGTVPLLVTQLSGWNDAPTSKLAQMQLDAHIRSAGKVLLVSPGYPFSVQNDCLHYTSDGERRIGEYFAKVYAKVVLGGETWEPVRPKQITRVANVVTVKFYVPVPPLVLDTTRVTNPGSYGFGVVDPSAATITGVAVTAPDTVTLTLSNTPTGPGSRLRYAQNQIPGGCIGPGTVYPGGARGNLRDSDLTPSQAGYDLFDWSVAFDVALP
jgi:hypothetical protein